MLESELEQLHYDAQKASIDLESERRVIIRLEMDLERASTQSMIDASAAQSGASAAHSAGAPAADGKSPENEKLLQEAADITDSTHALLMHMQQQLDDAVAKKAVAVADLEAAQATLVQERMTSKANVIAVGAELDKANANLELARQESVGGIQSGIKRLSTQMNEMSGSIAGSLASLSETDKLEIIDGDNGEEVASEQGDKAGPPRRRSKQNVTELGAGLNKSSTALAKSSTALALSSNENIRLKREAVLAKAERDRSACLPRPPPLPPYVSTSLLFWIRKHLHYECEYAPRAVLRAYGILPSCTIRGAFSFIHAFC